jgi:hypothetical protein
LSVLRRLGLEVEPLDAGCCGMAGAFGFEADHYAVSEAVGERRLLPAVRQAGAGTLLVADGFSCREQIAQLTERRAVHLAEIVRLALHPELQGAHPCAESRLIDAHRRPAAAPEPRELLLLGILAGALVAAGRAIWRRMGGDR